MITYVKGDVRDTDAPIIAHGCNAQGAMGSGVARALYEKWPQVRESYMEWAKLCEDAGLGKMPMGAMQFVGVEANQRVVNIITQDNYGKEGTKYVSYDAVDRAMIELKDTVLYALEAGLLKGPLVIAMPKIGSGLGGGNWEVIEAIINHRMKDIDVRVYEL